MPNHIAPGPVTGTAVWKTLRLCGVQVIAEQLEHPLHWRRMAMVCRAWMDAMPVTSYDVVLCPLLGLSDVSSRLAAITARHSSLTSLSFRCDLWTARKACMLRCQGFISTSESKGGCTRTE